MAMAAIGVELFSANSVGRTLFMLIVLKPISIFQSPAWFFT
jgi:hypothetical protein